MSKNEIRRKYTKVNRMINQAETEGDYRKRQALEKQRIKIADAYFLNFIMPQLSKGRAGEGI